MKVSLNNVSGLKFNIEDSEGWMDTFYFNEEESVAILYHRSLSTKSAVSYIFNRLKAWGYRKITRDNVKKAVEAAFSR